PHPNQVRAACERCRHQKLRCTRPATDSASASCARCVRLGLNCQAQAGPQRRIGRPPKKSLVLRKKPSDVAAAGPVGNNSSLARAAGDTDFQFLDYLLDDTATVPLEWYTSANSLPSFSASLGSFNLPMECWPGVKQLENFVEEREQQTVLTPSNRHFEGLSRLNFDIRKGWDSLNRLPTLPTFKEFICDMDGYKNMQVLITNFQEFLSLIKALHRQIGTRGKSKQNRTACWESLAATVNPYYSSSSASPSSDDTSPQEAPRPSATHDSPTMFLVISCYVQLIRHMESVLKIVYDSINSPTAESISPAPMAYADVPIIEASSQCILFFELLHHVIGQTNLVLGLPSPWSGRSAWTGLLHQERYRAMINEELGDVQGLWTTRPIRLLELMKVSKEMFIEFSMMGGDA
ncbi:hypothetical protein BGZ63DRAFT_321122, partial [Mariannaea sp. PMI_226]